MRIVTALLLGVHGLIHTLGFLRAWSPTAVPQLSGRTIIPLSPAAFRLLGLVWLGVAVALLTAALLRAINRDAWWMVAAPALFVSQALVILHWGDAWAGTLANLLLGSAVGVAAGLSGFHADNVARARAFIARAQARDSQVVRPEDTAHLPAPVQRWLRASGAVGSPRAHTVRLKQRGGMRTAPDQAYMPAAAVQYFTVDEPGFLWMVDVTMMRVLPVTGRDTFLDGHGHMLIKAGGLVPVADARGPKIDQGAALRFLGEIVWFPSAALSPAISWAPLDDRRATATLAVHDVSVSAGFEFDEHGRFVHLVADRYYGGDTLERWEIPATAWKTIRGIEMPVEGGAVWKLRAGDFDYYQWRILDVEVNRPTLWDDD